MKIYKQWEGTHSPGEYAYQKWEDAWRAALEEVLKQLNNIYNGDFENSEIVSWIKEELEDEKFREVV